MTTKVRRGHLVRSNQPEMKAIERDKKEHFENASDDGDNALKRRARKAAEVEDPLKNNSDEAQPNPEPASEDHFALGMVPTYEFTPENGVTYPKCAVGPPKDLTDVVQQRVAELRELLEQPWFPSEERKNVQAIIHAYKTLEPIHPAEGEGKDEFSFWVNGQKVSRDAAFDAEKGAAWSEPVYDLVRWKIFAHIARKDGRNQFAIVHPLHDVAPTQTEIDNGVFEAKQNFQQMYDDRPFSSRRVFQYEGRLAVRFPPAVRTRIRPPPGPILNPLTNEVSQFIYEGVVCVKGIIDTGACLSYFGSNILRDLMYYFRYDGPRYWHKAKFGNGTESWGVYVWLEYCWVHYQTGTALTPVRLNVFGFPAPGMPGSNEPQPSLLGLNILSIDHWILNRGEQTLSTNGAGYYKEGRDNPRLFQCTPGNFNNYVQETWDANNGLRP